jgi:hypothetical protein
MAMDDIDMISSQYHRLSRACETAKKTARTRVLFAPEKDAPSGETGGVQERGVIQGAIG